MALPSAEGAGGADVLEVAGAQELGADDADEARPGEEGDEQRQEPEVHREDRREDDDDVEARHVAPDLDDALEDEVDPAAEVALGGAGEDADEAGDDGDDEREEDRDAEAVDDAGHHVAGLVVGAEPVGAVGRRGRGRHVVVDGVVAEGDERPEHPAGLGDGLAVGGALVARLLVDALRIVEAGLDAAGARSGSAPRGRSIPPGSGTRRRSRPRSRSGRSGSGSSSWKRTTSGLSLATNSAQRVTRKSARKIQSDQKARRLALKFWRRRRCSGVRRIRSRGFRSRCGDRPRHR